MGGFAQHVFDRDQAARDEQIKLQTAPLSESLRADQTRLALYANPDDPTKPLPGKEDQYNSTLNRMTQTIGQLRSLYGQKPSGANSVEAGAGNLLDKLHITNHLKNHVANVRAENAKKYQDQSVAAAGAYAAGALPYSMTPEGQAETKKAADERALEVQRAKSAEDVEKMRTQSALDVARERETAKVPKGFKPVEASGVTIGLTDQDTGKQYAADQLGPKGDAPQVAKEMWQTIQNAQEQKRIEQEKRDERANAALSNRENNMGTWSVVEGDNGETKLLNTKTGEMRDAPEGLHKSGYYAKQVAPLEAARMNISSYIDGRVYDGPGDLALQHEFFTATQPATGFRMTKVQQDILQNSQNWLNSIQAKAYHFAHGTWFSDEQRRQIAKAAQDAIDAKKKVLMRSSGGPKTDEIRKKAQGGKTINYKIVNGELVPE